MPASSGLLPYLRLIRAPAVFSALGDPLAGALIAGGQLPPARAVKLAGAAGALYLAGMALNDFADREEDARDRSERPIPAGDVSAGAAALLGSGLLVAGVLAAREAGAGRTGAMLATMIVGYDFVFKRSRMLGPPAMGVCRGLSLLMGAESGAGQRGVQAGAGAAGILAAYIAGVTLLARGETGADHTLEITGGAALTAAAAMAAATRSRRALPWAVAVAALAGPAVAHAVREPVPARVGPAVGALIRAIPALDGALVAARAPRYALIMLPLLGLVRWGRKLFPIH